MPARIDDLLVLNANLNKSDFAKYLRDREAVLPNDFGGLGDGVADVVNAVHRVQCDGVVEQHGAGDGAEHLRRDVRLGGGDAVGAGG